MTGNNNNSSSTQHLPGILGMEVYIPKLYIEQSDLEQHTLGEKGKGKYTIGLGQQQLCIPCGDVEDIHSICLTVVTNLLEKYNIHPSEIGRLEVGTETLIDKSKSTKTVLMDLFAPYNNTDIEGATIVNACYGGTAALLNAFAWVQQSSSYNDGRYAIVVAADIATYAAGPARPTCGCGAVAVLIGMDAPIYFHPQYRTTHASNTYDFYKPDHTVEYPVVDGALSQICYYTALEDCYQRFCMKMEQQQQLQQQTNDDTQKVETTTVFDATVPDYFVFHAPYNKLVQKSYGRLFYIDARRRYEISKKQKEAEQESETIANGGSKVNDEKKLEHDHSDKNNAIKEEWLTMDIKDTYNDRELENVIKKVSSEHFQKKLYDANYTSQHIGNTYTASVFFGIASLIHRQYTQLLDSGSNGSKQIVVFSYGSGAIATMYQLQIRTPTQTRFTLEKMAHILDITNRLQQREKVHPNELDYALETRAKMHNAGAPYNPIYPTDRFFPGTYYLNNIDSKWRRSYSRVPPELPEVANGSSNTNVSSSDSTTTKTLVPQIVLQSAQEEQNVAVLSPAATEKMVESSPAIQTVEMKRNVACVITGTAAGLPGRPLAFHKDNMDRLINGEQCITAIPPNGITALLEKNVVQTRKLNDGSTERVPVNNESEVIKLAAQLGCCDLTQSYGVSDGLAQTMDIAAQVAVAAGLEALKDAGLVSGRSNDPKEWMLPEQYRDTTGVVYASSFPAMDAAVGEVMRFLKSKTVTATDSEHLIETIRERLLRGSSNNTISDDDEVALQRLTASAQQCNGGHHKSEKPYEFDRKFLFRVLVLGNAQLAQLAGCRGPNTQTNAACAGTTQAIAMAQDMLISGRAQRVVVVAGDNASGSTLLPWLGSGFRALGAACTKAAVEDASMPFDKRRSGMLLGAGGIGMVLETEQSQIERQRVSPYPFVAKARLLATQYSNSAFHGAALDRNHIAAELKRFLSDVELLYNISKAEIASHGVYFSHETSTHASDSSSCSGNEIAALRSAFGDELLSKLLIVNTKGFTGHPMGVSFEDVTAVEVLIRQQVPPVPNYKEKDDYLGELNISKGGKIACRYALRFAAGFGSQVAFALYATA